MIMRVAVFLAAALGVHAFAGELRLAAGQQVSPACAARLWGVPVIMRPGPQR